MAIARNKLEALWCAFKVYVEIWVYLGNRKSPQAPWSLSIIWKKTASDLGRSLQRNTIVTTIRKISGYGSSTMNCQVHFNYNSTGTLYRELPFRTVNLVSDRNEPLWLRSPLMRWRGYYCNMLVIYHIDVKIQLLPKIALQLYYNNYKEFGL